MSRSVSIPPGERKAQVIAVASWGCLLGERER